MTVRILQGDCRQVLGTLPEASVHCCVTSPPYWGLRDYGVDGQIGLEDSIDTWVSEIVGVMRAVRRVLREDGTLWLNLGDSYASNAGQGTRGGPPSKSSTLQGNGHVGGGPKLASLSRIGASRNKGNIGSDTLPRSTGLKPKDLIGQPWLVAFALRTDGAASPRHMADVERMISAIEASYDSREEWPDRIRSEVERLEQEHIEANRGGWYLRQEIIWHKPNPMPESVRDRCTKAHEQIFLLSKSPRYYYDFEAMQEPCSPNTHARLSQNIDAQAGSTRAHAGGKTNGTMKAVGRRSGPPGNPQEKNNENFNEAMAVMPSTRNKRSVWTVASEAFSEAHFATFPPALIEPCIRAGCPEGGTVLDPFGGAGTTGLVADRLQRSALLVELNPAYIDIARRRIGGDAPLFADVATA